MKKGISEMEVHDKKMELAKKWHLDSDKFKSKSGDLKIIKQKGD